MKPNPNNYRPNWSLVGGSALAMSPVPLQLVGALVGTYVGANIGLALSCKD